MQNWYEIAVERYDARHPGLLATVGDQDLVAGRDCAARDDARVMFKIGMMNLSYNIRRLVQLKRMAAAPA